MNLESSLPPIKTSEPVSVSPLLERWIQDGFNWKGMQMFWLGADTSRQHYRLRGPENSELDLFVIPIFSDEEKIIFRGFQDWFAASIRKLSESCRGYFTFDVLQFEVGDAPWSWNDFTVLLKAHALKLGVGERRLIQFGSLWGVLERRTEADFGRVESKLHLEFCKSSPEACARLVKKHAAKLPENSQTTLVFRDLSRNAVCPGELSNEFLEGLFRPNLTCANQRLQFAYRHGLSRRCLSVGLLS